MQHTPGPWAWFGNQHGFYLATTHSGRRFVMDFVRMGMRYAQPRFQESGIMENAADLVTFAVGDGNAKGMTEGKADPSVYRYDITGIDHPDARLIAAAPELLDACYAALAVTEAEGANATSDIIRAAIAKAIGSGDPPNPEERQDA